MTSLAGACPDEVIIRTSLASMGRRHCRGKWRGIGLLTDAANHPPGWCTRSSASCLTKAAR
eukprot:12142676-Heterocapsa_arctica.AAC.1